MHERDKPESAKLFVDPQLRVVAAAGAGVLPETCAIAQTSWGLVELAGLPGEDLAALLAAVAEHADREVIAASFAEERGYDRDDVPAVLEELLDRGVITEASG